MSTETGNVLLIAVASMISFIIGTIFGASLAHLFYMKYARKEMPKKQQQKALGQITFFFAIITALYIVITVFHPTANPDPIIVSILAAAALGQNVGGIIAQKKETPHEKNK